MLAVASGAVEKLQLLCWALFATLFTPGTSCLLCCSQLTWNPAREIIPQIPLFSFQFPSYATSFILFPFSLLKSGWRGNLRKSKCFSLLSSCTLKTAQLPIQILCITHQTTACSRQGFSVCFLSRSLCPDSLAGSGHGTRRKIAGCLVTASNFKVEPRERN